MIETTKRKSLVMNPHEISPASIVKYGQIPMFCLLNTYHFMITSHETTIKWVCLVPQQIPW